MDHAVLNIYAGIFRVLYWSVLSASLHRAAALQVCAILDANVTSILHVVYLTRPVSSLLFSRWPVAVSNHIRRAALTI